MSAHEVEEVRQRVFERRQSERRTFGDRNPRLARPRLASTSNHAPRTSYSETHRGSGAAAAASPVHAYRDAYVAALGCGSQSSDVHRYPKGRPPNDNATDTEISRVCSYTETQPQTQTHAVITTIQMLSLAPRARSKSVAHTTDVTMILFLRNDTSNTQLLLSY